MEIWKDIPGYEGKYQASTEGRIRSVSRVVKGKCHFTGNSFERQIKSHILRPGRYCKNNHVSVVLGQGTAGKPVHQLIMLTFVGEKPEGMEVLNRNGEPKNNRLKNHRNYKKTENILYVKKKKKKWRKLSIDDVEEIRFALFCGITGTELAKQYGVSATTISSIKSGRTFWWL